MATHLEREWERLRDELQNRRAALWDWRDYPNVAAIRKKLDELIELVEAEIPDA